MSESIQKELDSLRRVVSEYEKALKLIEHATAPGDKDAYHENAYDIAKSALNRNKSI